MVHEAPPPPCRLLFAHGAGAGTAHPWMQRWAVALAQLGHVRAFDYDYMAAGKRAPDRLPKLLARHEAELEALAADPQAGDGPLVLVGKSMGGRVGCHVAAARVEAHDPAQSRVAAVVCLGYPLKAPGKSGKVRDEVLLAAKTPTLFVQGTRDPLCPLPLLAEVRAKMGAPTALHVVDTGDHSLMVTKTHTKQTGTTQADADAAALAAIAAFLGEHAVGR